MILGQSRELHEYGIKNGHPPMAEKTVLIDFDATVRRWDALMNDGVEPEPGAIEAIQELEDRGYRIVIFTSRMSRKWAATVVGDSVKEQDDFLAGQYEFVRKYLVRYGIVPADITSEKQPSLAYIDDRAIGYRGNWQEVLNDPLIQ